MLSLLPRLPTGGIRARSLAKARTAPVGSYTTTFSADENPISEGGEWAKNASNAWAEIRTVSGNATGTQGQFGNAGNDWNDSYTIKQGAWGADYKLTAIVYRSASISAANHEIELNLRFSDGDTTARCYECLLNKDGAIQFFRWEGPFNTFSAGYTPVTGTDSVGSVPDGAFFEVQIVGDVVTVRYNSSGTPTETAQCTYNINDVAGNKYTDGNPSIAAFCQPAIDGSNADHFGFKSVTITRL